MNDVNIAALSKLDPLPAAFRAVPAVGAFYELQARNMMEFSRSLLMLADAGKTATLAFYEQAGYLGDDIASLLRANTDLAAAFWGRDATGLKGGMKKSLTCSRLLSQHAALGLSAIAGAAAKHADSARENLFSRAEDAVDEIADGFDKAVDAVYGSGSRK